MKLSREELARNVDDAEWGVLRAHLERGGLITVASGLDIVEVGLKIATNDSAAVGAWIADGKLAKPTAEDISVWDTTRGKTFRCLIVSPYVLMQEKATLQH